MTANNKPLFFLLGVMALEDLHTGAGTGHGDIDALLLRNRHGYPVIRASHFEGLLREAGEELVYLQQKAEEKQRTKAALNVLLGAAGGTGSALRMTSLYVTKACKAEGVKTLIWGSSARETGKRNPREDTLRFVEYVAAGTCFQAILRLPPGSDQDDQKTLLVSLLNHIDRIGGGRNRGSGLVKLDWQLCCDLSAVLKEQSASKQAQLSPLGAQFSHAGARIRLVLRNLEPLCLPTTGHPGNLIRSQSFIRGQTLRGALVAWAFANEYAPIAATVSVGDALPLPGNDAVEVVLPMPLAILTEKPKASGTDRPWWAGGSAGTVSSDSLKEEKKYEGEKRKRPGSHEYLCKCNPNDGWSRYTPALNVRLRNQTPKDTKSDAELFSLEEIAEDTCFQAELQFDSAENAQQFIKVYESLLTGHDWLTIGRGGQPVMVESYSLVQSSEQNKAACKDNWTLTLISDLIVRGPNLGFYDNLSIDILCELGDSKIEKQADWQIEKAVVETETIYGFNAASGRHRAVALALRRGSCWHITGNGSNVLASALSKHAPLGERTREGFGRFAIDLQPIASMSKPVHEKTQPERSRQEEILCVAEKLSTIKHAGTPSASQLQWLRERALAAQNIEDLTALLQEIKEAPEKRQIGGSAWRQFPTKQLENELKEINILPEKRLLISYLVQYLILNKQVSR